MLKILGYPDRYSVVPGEQISFQISLEEGNDYAARIVRVLNGDSQSGRPRARPSAYAQRVDGRYKGVPWRVDAGSYFVVPDFPPFDTCTRAFSFRMLIWPTLIGRPSQVLAAQWDTASQSGFKLMVEGGRLTLIIGDGSGTIAREALAVSMLERKWYVVTFVINLAERRFQLAQTALQADFGVEDSGSREGWPGLR